MKSRITSVCLAAVAGGAVGFLAGSGRRSEAPPAGVAVKAPAAPAARVGSSTTERPTAPEVLVRPDQVAALLTGIQKEPDPELRRDQLRVLAARIAPSDAAACLDIAQSILTPEYLFLFRYRLLELWASRAPQAALAWSQALPNRGDREPMLDAVLHGWVLSDPSAMVRWFSTLPKGPDRKAALTPLALALGRFAPEVGLGFLKGLPESNDRREFLIEFLGAWADIDPRAAARS
ncbi:MAG: hypothetical protein ACKO3H_11510, partial [Verrucomicrobiota bacterium]